MPPSGNRFLFVAIASSLAATLAGVYLPGLSDLLGTQPLTATEIALAVAVAAVPAVVIELLELLRPGATGRRTGTGRVLRPWAGTGRAGRLRR